MCSRWAPFVFSVGWGQAMSQIHRNLYVGKVMVCTILNGAEWVCVPLCVCVCVCVCVHICVYMYVCGCMCLCGCCVYMYVCIYDISHNLFELNQWGAHPIPQSSRNLMFFGKKLCSSLWKISTFAYLYLEFSLVTNPGVMSPFYKRRHIAFGTVCVGVTISILDQNL